MGTAMSSSSHDPSGPLPNLTRMSSHQQRLSLWQWLRQNLFNGGFNSLLTVICLWGLYAIFSNLIPWVLSQAQWAVVRTNLSLFLVGRFPKDDLWRIWGLLGLFFVALGLSVGLLSNLSRRIWIVISASVVGLWGVVILGQGDFSHGLMIIGIGTLGSLCLLLGQQLRLHPRTPRLLKFLPLLWVATFIATLWLIGGGFGLAEISQTRWQGLLLTLLMAIAGIGLSFPLGVILALGRRSKLPVFRLLSTLYIEIIRGLPLIGILFSVQVLLPLLFPPNVAFDSVTRTAAGLIVFSSAYLAENVRGGLQALPQGQMEAAQSLGLSKMHSLGLIVLPQALKAVIPAIVGQFIGLFKDTSLLSLVGLFELTGMARTILSQPEFVGRNTEVYAFIGVIYYIFCYLMSLGSRKLEATLASGST